MLDRYVEPSVHQTRRAQRLLGVISLLRFFSAHSFCFLNLFLSWHIKSVLHRPSRVRKARVRCCSYVCLDGCGGAGMRAQMVYELRQATRSRPCADGDQRSKKNHSQRNRGRSSTLGHVTYHVYCAKTHYSQRKRGLSACFESSCFEECACNNVIACTQSRRAFLCMIMMMMTVWCSHHC